MRALTPLAFVAMALPLCAASPVHDVTAHPTVMRIAPEQAGPTWFSGTISYDDSGNIYRIGDSAGPDGDHMVTTFTYDLLSRLVATSHQKQDPSATGIPRTESYSYDSYGTRIHKVSATAASANRGDLEH